MRCLSSAMLIALAGLAASPAPAGEARVVQDRTFLTFIGLLEAPLGYNQVSNHAIGYPGKPLVQMTIDEILAWQEAQIAAGAKSTAIGRYQFIRDTLAMIVSANDISGEALFDRSMQDYLARIMLHRCDFYHEDRDIHELANCLAGTWAALPVATGPDAGRSRYDHLIGNKALTRVSVVLAMLRTRFGTGAPPSAESTGQTGEIVTRRASSPSIAVVDHAYDWRRP